MARWLRANLPASITAFSSTSITVGREGSREGGSLYAQGHRGDANQPHDAPGPVPCAPAPAIQFHDAPGSPGGDRAPKSQTSPWSCFLVLGGGRAFRVGGAASGLAAVPRPCCCGSWCGRRRPCGCRIQTTARRLRGVPQGPAHWRPPVHLPCVKTIAEAKVMLGTPLVLADWTPSRSRRQGRREARERAEDKSTGGAPTHRNRHRH